MAARLHGTYGKYQIDKCRCSSCSEGYRVARIPWSRKWDAANREKRHAHDAVYRAIQAGRLTRPNVCEHCAANVFTEASHTDYTQKLDVEWLCRPCHRRKDGLA